MESRRHSGAAGDAGVAPDWDGGPCIGVAPVCPWASESGRNLGVRTTPRKRNPIGRDLRGDTKKLSLRRMGKLGAPSCIQDEGHPEGKCRGHGGTQR